jgi:tetratricopeptide (TPR) repeat protein
MSGVNTKLLETYQVLAGRLTGRPNAIHAKDLDALIAFFGRAINQGQPELAISLLEPVATPQCKTAPIWQMLGLAYREVQDMEGALAALAKAAALDPKNATTAFAYAQALFETARPSTEAFAIARALAPLNPVLIRNSAAALAADGFMDEAEAMLQRTLAREPLWLDGHKTLAAIRVASGRGDDFDASFKAACLSQPQNLGLRLAWIHLLSTARAWDGACKVLHQAQADFGLQRGLELTRVHIASESGDIAGDDPALFDQLGDAADPGLDLCRVRHALRLGNPKVAAAICDSYLNSPMATLFWPYLSLAWRLLDDSRAAWLDGELPAIQQFDLGLTEQELAELTLCLQSLHTAQAPILEQSVRGGTQTDRQLFFRPVPILQYVRTKVQSCITTYVEQLGEAVEGHPLLSPPRNRAVMFGGSWSVRLKGGGHHTTHTHPKGWISSALYVDLPPQNVIGAPPAGWISFGEGPPELKLGLSPYQQIKPEVGKLVLFPSTLWHRTVPFDDGERLTIAFDVKVPTMRLNP